MLDKSSHISKEEFINLLKKGRTHAYEVLFRVYYDKLLHIAIGYICKRMESEGIVQDVFLKLWEQRERLEKIDNINSYLYKMTRNKCLDYIKHQKVEKKYIVAEKSFELQYAFVEDEDASQILKNELEKRVTESIKLLPERCRKVFVKSKIEGLKHIEIAKLLGISKRTVDNHVAYAQKLLMRHYLKEFFIFLWFLLSNY